MTKVRGMRPGIVLGIAALLALLAVAGKGDGILQPPPAAAGGATIVVDTLADPAGPGECGLRAAIINANQNDQSGSPNCAPGMGADTILFSVEGVINLSTDLPSITDPGGLTIDGGGKVTLSGMNSYRPFLVPPGGSLTVERITMTDARGGEGGAIEVRGFLIVRDSYILDSEASFYGGGIRIGSDGSVEVHRTSIIGNEGGLGGGGIANEGGTLEVYDSIIEDNRSLEGGGGIWIAQAAGTTVIDSVIRDNRAGYGGGIGNHSGSLTLRGSTVSDNIASTHGGGIRVNSGNATVTNSTISGNLATSGHGGGISNAAVVSLRNSTVAGNGAGGQGGGIYNEGTVNMVNTIVAQPVFQTGCAGTPPVSGGHNLDTDATCNLSAAGDRPGADANLGPLANNGGPTQTHALLEGSDAIDSGDNAICAVEPVNGVDQRGAPRPHGEACDIGAFEFGATPPGASTWGDLDCDGSVVIGDALKTARYLLGLSVSQEEGCPEPGGDVTVDGEPRLWGDVDCDDSIVIGDALKIARHLLKLSVSQEEGCPEVGAEVFVQ